ncbi:MAG: hypothetical protein OEZ52_13250, partial [Candidatus Aminicenantes bacterium]|nr:hypothetical protein [Candidatus Aminicenantes bacterium]
INFYLKDKPSGPVEIEITDATGTLKTIYPVKNADAGLNRLMWDMQFDPSPEQLKQSLTQMQQMVERILQRPEVEEEQKKIVQEALEKLKQPGLTYRETTAIQREAFEAIGFGGAMSFMGRFGPRTRAPIAEPGAYAVKLTVNGKTYTDKVTVRQDPMLEGSRNWTQRSE